MSSGKASRRIRLLLRPRHAAGDTGAHDVQEDIVEKALGRELYGSENRLPVTGVTVGPSVRQALNVGSVKMLLARYGYKKLRVRTSATPFRG